MADNDGPKMVKRELLATGMYLGGTDKRRGDVIELTEEQAENLDKLGLTAEEGHLEKLEEERQESERQRAEREEEQRRLDDEEANRRQAHGHDILVGHGPAGHPGVNPDGTREPVGESGGESGGSIPAGSSGDGSKVEKPAGASRRR